MSIMNTGILLITLFSFLNIKESQCSENTADQDYKNLAENYAKWMQKSLTPDMFAFRGRISPLALPMDTNREVNDSAQYVSGVYSNSILEIFTSQCTRDLLYTISSIKSQWAIKMLDSYGKLQSGILEGNFKWPGDYIECKNVYAPPKTNASMGNFHGRYCTTSWQINLGNISIPLPVSIGVCVPDSCDEHQIKSDAQNILYIIERFSAFVRNESNETVSFVNMTDISCKPLEVGFDGPAIGMICFLSILGLLLAAGSMLTIFEYFVPSTKKDPSHFSNRLFIQNYAENEISTNDVSINHAAATGESVLSEHSQNGADSKPILVDSNLEKEASVSIVSRFVKPFLKSFCIFTNGAKILNTNVSDGQLLCIHGIRFLSMAWVILGHTYAFGALNGIANTVEAVRETDTWEFQVILQGTLSVDSFFVLSGFLLTYLFLKEIDKKDGKVSWLLFYVHRYWRLTPVYMIVLGFDTALTRYLSSGPFWSEGGFELSCKETWWRNLLYINNFGDANKQCFGWAWYLANDMQFYIISPVFLYALWRWPKAGLSIVFTLLLSSWITSAVITVKLNLIATYGAITTDTNLLEIMTQMGDYFWKMYVKPYTRIGPYLIGVLAGYLLYKTGDKKKFLEPWICLLGWSIATALPLCVIFGVYDARFTTSSAAAYNALSRSAFALSLAWIIYACQTGHGDIVNKILSWKMFIPLSRLTYCAYLVHPIVIIGFYQSLLQPFYFSHLSEVALFFGFLIMSYMAALVTSLSMESPMMGIEKLLLKKR